MSFLVWVGVTDIHLIVQRSRGRMNEQTNNACVVVNTIDSFPWMTHHAMMNCPTCPTYPAYHSHADSCLMIVRLLGALIDHCELGLAPDAEASGTNCTTNPPCVGAADALTGVADVAKATHARGHRGTFAGGTISSAAAAAAAVRFCAKKVVLMLPSVFDSKVTPVPTAHCAGHHGMSIVATFPSEETEAMVVASQVVRGERV